MINSHQKAFKSIFHISYSATVNNELGKRFSIKEEKGKKRKEKKDTKILA